MKNSKWKMLLLAVIVIPALLLVLVLLVGYLVTLVIQFLVNVAEKCFDMIIHQLNILSTFLTAVPFKVTHIDESIGKIVIFKTARHAIEYGTGKQLNDKSNYQVINVRKVDSIYLVDIQYEKQTGSSYLTTELKNLAFRIS